MARPRTFDESKVLDDALEVFRAYGYEGTSVPLLIERLGICRQSLYTAFGDKRRLYIRALERWGQREVDAKLALLSGPGSPLENLRTVIRGWADLAARCPADGCLTVATIVEARGDGEALSIAEAQVARLEEGFRSALQRARDAGELRSDVRPGQLARTLTTVGYGIGILARLASSGVRIGDTVSALLGLLDDAAA